MGAWGSGLYQDDEALDLKNSLALLTKMPVSGDRILEILLEAQTTAPELETTSGPMFWLVVADQFEKRGIRCARALSQALKAIDDGYDVRALKELDMDDSGIRKRLSMHKDLRARLVSPSAEKKRPSTLRPPKSPISIGDVFSFPTMFGEGANPWSAEPVKLSAGVPFTPNGFGAFLVLDSGRAFDWFPWCKYAMLGVDPAVEPTIESVRDTPVLGSYPVNFGVPRSLHLRRIQARLIGRLPVDVEKVRGMPKEPFEESLTRATVIGRSIYPLGIGSGTGTIRGPLVRDFLK